MARGRALNSSRGTSSALRRRPSTTPPAPTARRTARCWASREQLVREMAIEASNEAAARRRIRLGMVGGGQGAFIGAVHRIAARIDDQFELVAGALSSDPVRAKASAKELGIADDRAYGSFEEMAKAEAARADGIEAVSIVTPNHLHSPVAKIF